MTKLNITRLFILTLLFNISLFLFSFYFTEEIFDDHNENTQKYHNAARDIYKSSTLFWLKNNINNVNYWARSPTVISETKKLLKLNKEGIIKSSSLKTLRRYLFPIIMNHNYDGFFIIDRNGVSIGSMRNSNIGVKNLVTSEGNFFKTVLTGKSLISSPIASDVPLPRDGVLKPDAVSIFAGAPVFVDGKVQAVFLFRINSQSSLKEIFENTSFSKTGKVFAFDGFGNLINFSKYTNSLMLERGKKFDHKITPSLKLTVPGSNKLIAPVESALKGVSIGHNHSYKNVFGKKAIGSWYWDKDYQFGLVAESELSEVQYVVDYFRQIIIISLIGISFLIWFIFFLVSKDRESLEHDNAKLEHLVEQRTMHIKHLVKTRQDFLTKVSHEIRTPLNGIHGLSHLALDDISSAEKSRHIKTVSKLSEHLLGLANDFLDLGKIESGKFKLNLTARSLEFLSEISNVFTNRLKKKEIELVFNSNFSDETIVLVDALRITQICFNIISNSIKFTDSGTVTFSVDAKPLRSNTIAVNITVTDTGQGMNAEDLVNLFEPFYQGKNSNSSEQIGTGLGLSITKELVVLMDGDLSVESTLGKGTTTKVSLVLQKAETSTLVKKNKISLDCSSIKILIAEDNEVNIVVFKNMLKKNGFENFTIVKNGEEVLDSIDESFDIILLDYNMPKLNGPETAKLIKERGGHFCNLPIVLISANVLDNISISRREFFSAQISKPINYDVLKDVIVKLVTEYRLKEKI